MTSIVVRVAGAAAFCALLAYWLTTMDDTSTPPRDDSSGEYFRAFIMLGPALIGLLLTIGRSVSTYVLVALAGAWALAAVVAIDSEVTNYDSATGVLLILGFILSSMAALPGILVIAATRFGLALLRR